MNKQEFQNILKDKFLFLDGATGSNLQKRGMPSGVCPELWITENKEVLIGLQKEYVEAGSNVVYAPTFSANRIKLDGYGLADRTEELNKTLVAISREAAGDKAYVAGDLTMTGELLEPIGTLSFEELIDIYKEQIGCLDQAGVDLLIVETMMSLQECRAAVLAIREVCDLPIMATLTYNDDGRTLYGTPPEVAINVLQSLGVDAVGVNCSTGPEGMVPIVEKMAEYATIPLIAKPNAGLPELEGMETVYRMTPEEFARTGKKLIEAGASLVGGCCGTTPAHVKALAEAVKGMTVRKPLAVHRRVLTSERAMVEVNLDGNFLVVGERINPTGKKALQAELREGKLDMVRKFAMEQEAAGAALLDINTGMNGIDEMAMTKEVIYEVSSTVDCPLVLDTSHIDVMEEALRIYPGRALINSISYESEKCDAMLALAKKYGAMFILLPLSDAGLPKDNTEKTEVLEKIYNKAISMGISHEDIIVDGLVTTVGANAAAGVECFDTISYCKEVKKLPTICGLSNISFGLPERGTVNATFLTMAMAKGMTMAIANPCQKQLMDAMFAADMLLHHPNADVTFVDKMNEANATEDDGHHPIHRHVVKGNGIAILDAVKEELVLGTKAEAIINEYLIPAINEVGQYFNDGKYFLPQLIRSANTMKTAIDYVEPLLEKKETGEVLPTIVIATVKGDIHDIGKNLVKLMLETEGIHCIDLGVDVAPSMVVDAVREHHAELLCLSALLTTTMWAQKETIDALTTAGLREQVKVMVGGAPVTQEFADSIGADCYTPDAITAAREAKRFLTERKQRSV